MIYGDNPSENPVPDISAIMQSGNLYMYGMNNPVNLVDPTGMYTLVKDENSQVYAIIDSGDTLSAISYAEVRDSSAYLKLGYENPGELFVGQYVNITGIYNESYPILTNITLSKTSHTQGDSGLRGIPDDEIARRARDKSLSGEERRRYQKEKNYVEIEINKKEQAILLFKDHQIRKKEWG